MVSEKFRRQLRQEAEHWWNEGLIDRSIYEKLANRYQFSDLESAARNRFTAILMSLGGILMGLGTIIFVAANWDAWSRVSRLILLLSLFLSINATGFYLWQKPKLIPGSQKLGQSLLLLGAIILGANMALMSQLFHQSGNLYELFLAWGLGVVIMAFSLGLQSLGILAVILLQVGYWIGFVQGAIASNGSWGTGIIEHMPLIGLFLFIPLAYCCRSPAIFGLGTIAVMTSFFANLLRFEGWMIELAIGLPPALFWGYTHPFWKVGRPQAISSALNRQFQLIARRLATLYISSFLYVLSFNIWNEFKLGELGANQWSSFRIFLIDILILSGLTLGGWLQLRTVNLTGDVGKQTSIHSGTIAVLISLSASVLFWHLHISRIAILATVCHNIMLFLLSMSLIRDGLAWGVRHRFWGGTFLLSLGIVSRMLEYDTGLLLKSLVFVLCGVGVMLAGLAFEQNLKKSQQ